MTQDDHGEQPTGDLVLEIHDVALDCAWGGGGEGCCEHPVQGGAIDAEPWSDSGLRHSGADESACFGDLVVGELAGPHLGRLSDKKQ